MTTDRKIHIGTITGAHGIRGLVILRSFADVPENIAAYGPLANEAGTRQFEIDIRTVMKDHFIVALDGVSTREAAQALKGTKLYVPRSALPEPSPTEYYDADLIGLQVAGVDGVAIGSVTDVQNFGAGPLLEIKLTNGQAHLLPFSNDCVPDVDMRAGRVIIKPPDGWLEPAKPKG